MINLGPGLIFWKIQMNKIKENGLQLVVINWNARLTFLGLSCKILMGRSP